MSIEADALDKHYKVRNKLINILDTYGSAISGPVEEEFVACLNLLEEQSVLLSKILVESYNRENQDEN